RVRPGLTLDNIAAVARIPDEGVVAVAEKRGIAAAAADHKVVALASDDGVVAGAAIDGEADDICRQARRTDDVVAGARSDGQHIVGGFRAIDVHLFRQPCDRNRSTRTRDDDGVVAGGAVDGHAIGRAVAHTTAGYSSE